MHRTRLIPVFLATVIVTFGACGPASDSSPENPPMETTTADSSEPTTPEATAADSVHHHGIDVSHHQSDINWEAVKAAGITFVYAKATEGDDYIDPKFADNWEGIKAAGLVRGAYHFFHPHDSAQTQARNFIANVRLEPGDLPPVLDIEVGEGVSVENIDREVKIWLEMVYEAYGVKPIIYSGLHFIEANLDSGFSTYPLWLADYTDVVPAAPGDWEGWTFWQQSDDEMIEGIPGTVDRSVHHGTTITWQSLLVPPVE